MVIKIPEKVKFILNRLQSKGYEAYIVGGCVRDSLLGLEPKDWDITTDATPEEIKRNFSDKKIIETGIKHGTVTIVIEGESFEITTYRVDGDYSDNRHPDNVKFTSNLYEDLSRRDFTINAMAYNEDSGLIDYFNGQEDLSNKVIRTVGIPENIFKEDALRMIRAVRFKAKLKGFTISQDTQIAIKKLYKRLKLISVERIQSELNQILLYNPDCIKDMNDLGLSYIIDDHASWMLLMSNYDQNNPYHHLTLLDHVLNSIKVVDTLDLKLVMLFHDIGKIVTLIIDDNGISHYKGHAHESAKRAKKILTYLRYPNSTINKVATLIDIHDYTFVEEEKGIKKQLKRLLNQYGTVIVKDLIKVRIADISSQNPVYLYNRLNKIYLVKNILEDLLKHKECFSRKDLDINGNDLIELGFRGKDIGVILQDCLENVIDGKVLNINFELRKYILDNYSNILEED